MIESSASASPIRNSWLSPNAAWSPGSASIALPLPFSPVDCVLQAYLLITRVGFSSAEPTKFGVVSEFSQVFRLGTPMIFGIPFMRCCVFRPQKVPTTRALCFRSRSTHHGLRRNSCGGANFWRAAFFFRPCPSAASALPLGPSFNRQDTALRTQGWEFDALRTYQDAVASTRRPRRSSFHSKINSFRAMIHFAGFLFNLFEFRFPSIARCCVDVGREKDHRCYAFFSAEVWADPLGWQSAVSPGLIPSGACIGKPKPTLFPEG